LLLPEIPPAGFHSRAKAEQHLIAARRPRGRLRSQLAFPAA
jgi:hypothetical protein